MTIDLVSAGEHELLVSDGDIFAVLAENEGEMRAEQMGECEGRGGILGDVGEMVEEVEDPLAGLRELIDLPGIRPEEPEWSRVDRHPLKTRGIRVGREIPIR